VNKENLLGEIYAALETDHAQADFTGLFRRYSNLYSMDDAALSRCFTTSRPTVRRWLTGTVIPPGAALILRLMAEELEKELGL